MTALAGGVQLDAFETTAHRLEGEFYVSTRTLAGKTLCDALSEAIRLSGRLDNLIAEIERRKARTARYRAKRAEARRESM